MRPDHKPKIHGVGANERIWRWQDVCDDDISLLLQEDVETTTIRVPHDLPRTEPGVGPLVKMRETT